MSKELETISELEVDGDRVAIGRFDWKGVTYVALGGPPDSPLEDPDVYGPKLMEKAALLAKALRLLVQDPSKYGLPEPQVVHFHDWHTVPALVRVKELGSDAPAVVYHINLMLGQRLTLDYLTGPVGADPDAEHRIFLEGRRRSLSLREIFEMSEGLADRLGALEADALVTVSESYLKRDPGCVLETLGRVFQDKADYVPNGTDWRYESVLRAALEAHEERLREIASSWPPERIELRSYLLTEALGAMPESEPRLPSGHLGEWIASLEDYPFRGEGRVEPFESDGPLVIMTGRASKQKGIDVLVKALPTVIQRVPDARFLLLLIPVEGEADVAKLAAEASVRYGENLRVLFGRAASIFLLAHVAADAFAAPSLWEPFGIMALEAMASGVPLAASKTGGLSETVLDIREYGEAGTGLHVSPGDHAELAEAISSLLLMMEASHRMSRAEELASRIPIPQLAESVASDPSFGLKVRRSCIKRAEVDYSWDSAAEKALKVYGAAILRSRSAPC